MPGLIANCLARLVAGGEISEKAAKDALALHDGLQGRLDGEMPPVHADAAAALEAARIMAENARRWKTSIAKQAIRANEALERQAVHPRNRIAGLMAWLVRDIFEQQGGDNVQSKAEAIFGKLDERFGRGNEHLSARLGGLTQDRALAERVIRENFGVDTGDGIAKEISAAWKNATGYAVDRAIAGGRLFHSLNDWRQPQFWESSRLRKFGEQTFSADVVAEMRAGGLYLMDKRTGAPADQLAAATILHQAYEDITAGGDRGGAGTAFNPEMRVFRFAEGQAGADAYLRLMGKYGPGQDLYSMMRGHLRAAATEIAFTDLLGPDFRGTFRAMLAEARKDEARGRKSPFLTRFMSSSAAAERTFKVLAGESSAVQSELVAGIFGGLRAWLASAQLGSAVLAAVPGDSATIALAAQHNGISAVKVITRAVELIAADTKDKRALAARLGIVAHATADVALSSGRFQGEFMDHQTLGKVANAVIAWTGLQAWTEAAKRAFTMEMLGHIADMTRHAFADVDAPFRRFLERYGISPEEWDALRTAPLLDVDGAKFFGAGAIADVRLGEKILGGVIDERRFAVLESDALVKQALTGALPRGTMWGEIARSATLYKSFPLSLIVTHMMRAAMQDTLSNKVAYGLQLVLYTTIAGAVTLQAKALVTGKDPRPMNDKAFWGAALVAGGGIGIFGDLIYSGLTRADSSLAGTLIGPFGSLADAAGQLIFPGVRKAIEGKDTNLGQTLARQLKYNTPGSTAWYLRLPLDRLLWDRVQMAVDPDYRASFRRTRERAAEFGQKFWWGPGEGLPNRAPALGNVGG
jgi:hypothetical protein